MTTLARLPRAVCAAVLAFTSELVPARNAAAERLARNPETLSRLLGIDESEAVPMNLEPLPADFDDDPLIGDVKFFCRVHGMVWVSPNLWACRECNPDAAAVPPAAVCCSDGGVTPTVPPSEPPTPDPWCAYNHLMTDVTRQAKTHGYEHAAHYFDTDRNK